MKTTTNKPQCSARSRAKGRTIVRWTNVYPGGWVGNMYFTKKEAKGYASSDDAIQHKITITLPKPGAKSRGKEKVKG